MGFITPYLLIDIALCIVSVVYVYFRWSFGYWKRRGLPYLEPSIPYGTMDDPFRKKRTTGLTQKRHYDLLKAKNLKHGGIFIFTKPIYMAVDPEFVKSILSKDFNHFCDRGFYHNEKVDPLSAHIFNLTGDKWRNLRAKITPTFSSGKLKGMFGALVQCGEPLVEHVGRCAEKGVVIDIKEVVACYTIDVIGNCAFGIDCNSFTAEETPFRHYARRVFGTGSIRDISRLLLTFTFPKLAHALSLPVFPPAVAAFYMGVVRDTIAQRERQHVTRNDFLQMLMEMQAAGQLTFEQVAAQCFVFFLGGFDTSSSTISWALFELARNEEWQERARREVVEVMGRHGGRLDYEAVQELKFLGQIIDETLRKYPVLPQLHRECTKDYPLPDVPDCAIKKGERVTISVMGLHYDPDLFPDPNTFNPDRFSEENKQSIVPFSYLPFGDGPRFCLGARFALMQSKVGLGMLLKNFKFTVNEKTKMPISFDKKSIILAADGGLWLTATKI